MLDCLAATSVYSRRRPKKVLLSPSSLHIPTQNSLVGATFAEIGQAIGRDEVWVAAAFYAQAKFSKKEITDVCNFLGSITPSEVSELIGEHWWPDRGQVGPMPPRDPVIYRLYEVCILYDRWGPRGDVFRRQSWFMANLSRHVPSFSVSFLCLTLSKAIIHEKVCLCRLHKATDLTLKCSSEMVSCRP